MMTWGGATLGYCATGSEEMASRPARAMKIAITNAKLGRLMKKFGMMESVWAQGCRGAGCGAARGAVALIARLAGRAPGRRPLAQRRAGRDLGGASTMTWSPAASPCVICHSDPAWRRSAPDAPAPAVGRDQHLACPSAPRMTARCGTKMALLCTPCSALTRTYMPGSSSPSGLLNWPRSITWPVPGSTETSENSSLPLAV